jgi:hypothetical protein
MLVSIPEIADITDLSAQTIGSWVRNGWIEPARPGRSGRGQGSRMSLVQVYYILRAAVIHRLVKAGGVWLEGHPVVPCGKRKGGEDCLECQASNRRLLDYALTGQLDPWAEEAPKAEPFFARGSGGDKLMGEMLGRLQVLLRRKAGVGADGRPLPKAAAARTTRAARKTAKK